MDDHLYVHVPADLGELLTAADYDEVEVSLRSPGEAVQVAQAVFSVGGAGLPAAGSMVGIYLARAEIADFTRRVAAWFGLHRPAGPGVRAAPLVITVSAGGRESRVEISAAPGADGSPELDTAALSRLLASAVEATANPPGVPPVR